MWRKQSAMSRVVLVLNEEHFFLILHHCVSVSQRANDKFETLQNYLEIQDSILILLSNCACFEMPGSQNATSFNQQVRAFQNCIS